MARYTEAVCRLCRREGQKLFLKGDRCYTKCALENRSYAPGQHGQGRSKSSEYGSFARSRRQRDTTAFLRVSSAATMRWQSVVPARPAKTS